MKVSGKDLLFAEHLTEHVLQFCLFIERECSYLLFQSAFVNRSYLVGDNLAFASIHVTSYTERIIMNGGSDWDDDNGGKMLVEFLRAYNNARTHFLYLCTPVGLRSTQ